MIVLDTCALIFDALFPEKLTLPAKKTIQTAEKKHQLFFITSLFCCSCTFTNFICKGFDWQMGWNNSWKNWQPCLHADGHSNGPVAEARFAGFAMGLVCNMTVLSLHDRPTTGLSSLELGGVQTNREKPVVMRE